MCGEQNHVHFYSADVVLEAPAENFYYLNARQHIYDDEMRWVYVQGISLFDFTLNVVGWNGFNETRIKTKHR